MSDQTIHVLTEEERKAIRENKKFSILKGQGDGTKPPYAMVNGALELNHEMLLDNEVTKKESDDKLFEYEPEYDNTENISEFKDNEIEKIDNIENKNNEEKSEKVIKLLSDGEEVKKYIKPIKNVYLRNLPTLKLPENAVEIENSDVSTKNNDSEKTIIKNESKIIEHKSEEEKVETKEKIVDTKNDVIIDEKQENNIDKKVIERKVIVKELNRNTVLGSFEEGPVSIPSETKMFENIIEEKGDVIADKKIETNIKEKAIENTQKSNITKKDEDNNKTIVSLSSESNLNAKNFLSNGKIDDTVKNEIKTIAQIEETSFDKTKVVSEEKFVENKNDNLNKTNENITITNSEIKAISNEDIPKNIITENKIENKKVLVSNDNTGNEEKAILEEANMLLKNAIVDSNNVIKAQPIKLVKKHMMKNITKEESFVPLNIVNEAQTDEIYSRFKKQDLSQINSVITEIKEEKVETETQVNDLIPEVKSEQVENETQVSSVIPEVEPSQEENETQVSSVIPEVEPSQEENETQVSSVIPEVKPAQEENETQVSSVIPEVEPAQEENEAQVSAQIPEVKSAQVENETQEKTVSKELQAYLDELDQEIELPRKTRKLKVLFSPKNIDSLIKTKQFLVELEEIFRRIINNLELKHTKNSKKTRTERIKELEKIKSVLINVVKNKNISKHDKELVEGFLEDVLKHDSFYRKEIIKALDSIEIVYPLKLLGLGEKVSLIKDVVEGKEINALIGNILSRIDNLIVYNRFEKRKIQKYYISGEQDSKVNKIIHEFFNGNYLEFSDLAYKVRNEIENYDENRQVFTKVVEKFVKEEEKYRDKLKNAKIKNIYTLSIIFDQIINPRYDMDAKLIYLETFNSKKKLIY